MELNQRNLEAFFFNFSLSSLETTQVRCEPHVRRGVSGVLLGKFGGFGVRVAAVQRNCEDGGGGVLSFEISLRVAEEEAHE